jgi:curved DNA-binding protein CbpA
METKSLYTILGIRPDASAGEIEAAYASLLHQLKDGSEANPGGDDRIRLIAAKEAYSILADPIARQHYNQKIFAPQTIDNPPQIFIEPDNAWSITKLLVIGVFSLAAIGVYGYTTKENEKLRIQHDKELADNQLKLEQERLEQQRAMQQAQLAQQEELAKEAKERALRESAERESREVDLRLQQQAREKQQQDLIKQQRDEAQRRQDQFNAQRQVELEKQALQRLENENRRSYYRY